MHHDLLCLFHPFEPFPSWLQIPSAANHQCRRLSILHFISIISNGDKAYEQKKTPQKSLNLFFHAAFHCLLPVALSVELCRGEHPPWIRRGIFIQWKNEWWKKCRRKTNLITSDCEKGTACIEEPQFFQWILGRRQKCLWYSQSRPINPHCRCRYGLVVKGPEPLASLYTWMPVAF